MPTLPTLAAFVGAVLVLALTPGPDMMLLISRGVGQGWRIALYTAMGFTAAGIVQLPLLVVGLASLVQHSPVAFAIVKYAGAAYLIWRGIQLIRSRAQPRVVRAVLTTPWLALRDGIVASLTNPKGLIFLLAFLPQFVDPARGHVALQLLLLGGIMKLTALVTEGSVALAAGAIGDLLAQRPGFIRWQQRGTGLVMILLGVRLVLMREAKGR
jgi:threonine/homoserine/homoserine lactone efflux protein